MTFSIQSQSIYYEFPTAPQTYKITPQPRIAKLNTIGGRVIQLLGSSTELEFTGQLTIANNGDKFQRTAENGLFLKAGRLLCVDAKNGASANLIWSDRNLNETGAITGWTYECDLKTVAYYYKITMLVQQTAEELASQSYSSLFDDITEQIGFTDNGGGWHGGQKNAVAVWKKLKPITGLDFASTTSGQITDVPSGGMNPTQAQNYAHSILGQFGLSSNQWWMLQWLWNRESSWNWQAENSSSGAYGIAQWLGPHPDIVKASGVDMQEYRASAAAQIRWGLTYIQQRYGSIAQAYAHEMTYGWY